MEETIFQKVKNMISIIDVVERVLGEPDRTSGKEVYWFSQTHNEDTSSLGADVEKQIITDFSDKGFAEGADMFKFLVQLNNYPSSRKKGFISSTEINDFDALKWIVNEFKLDIDTNLSFSAPIQKKNAIEIHYSLEPSEMVSSDITDDIYAMFDSKEFTEKPKDNDVKSIKYRIGANLEPGSYTLKLLKEAITKGRTCIPTGVKSKKDWIDGESFCQIIMIDVDNVLAEGKIRTKLTVDNEKHITVDKIVEYCKSINLDPTFIYYTFSHSEEQHKFRLVYVLEKATQSKAEVEGIYEFLKKIFKNYNMDNSASDIARLFYGGTKIAYESDKFYKIKITEEAVEETLITDKNIQLPVLNETPKMTELANTCNRYFGSTNYIVRNGKLWNIANNKPSSISNFIVFVRNKINYTNGIDNIVKYQLECHILDNPSLELPLLTVDLDNYSNMKFLDGSVWENSAYFSAGKLNQDRQKEVMKIISRDTMQEYTIFANTGFERIDGNLCYLYHEGVIGNVQNVSVDLSDEGLERYCFTDKDFDIKQALQRSLSCLDVADYNITVPLLATIFLSPLTSILRENGISPNFIVFVQGKSGTRKSSLAATFLSHFGNFDSDTFPTTFRDSYNSIEKTAYILKDTTNIIDDYNPSVDGFKKLAIIDSIFGAYGDRVGRKRLNKDITTKKAYIPRGLCIVTGEMIPEVAQSRIARAIIVNIKQNSINLTKLSELQENKEELAYCMMNYIRWLIDNEKSIIEYAKSTFKELRKKQKSDVHGRTSDISRVLWIGFTLFTRFLCDYEVIDTAYKNKLDIEASKVLDELENSQTQYVSELKPTDLFYDAFEELLNTNAIAVININEYNPNWKYMTTNIAGYYDELKRVYYLYPDTVFNAVEKHYNNSSNKKFPVNAKTLWRYMAEEGLLERGLSYEKQNRYTVPKIINGRKGQFLPLKRREQKIGENIEIINRNPHLNGFTNNN